MGPYGPAAAEKSDDTRDFVEGCRHISVTPQVAMNIQRLGAREKAWLAANHHVRGYGDFKGTVGSLAICVPHEISGTTSIVQVAYLFNTSTPTISSAEECGGRGPPAAQGM